MADALELGYDLAGLAACFVALAFLYLVKGFAEGIVGGLDFSIFGFHPLRGLAHALENSLIAWLNDAIGGVENLGAGFINGLIDSFGLLIGVPLVLALGIKDALSYLWNHALSGFVEGKVAAVRKTAQRAETLAETAAGDVSALGKELRTKIANAASAVYETVTREYHAAIREAEKALNGNIDSLGHDLRAEFSAGLKGAEGTARSAVDTLREAERAADSALAAAEGATLGELHGLEKQIPFAEIAGIAAAVPVLSALIATLEAESGLDSPECRSKVKGVCSVPAERWAKLLAGLVLAADWPGLEELAEGLADMTGEVVAAVTDLIGV